MILSSLLVLLLAGGVGCNENLCTNSNSQSRQRSVSDFTQSGTPYFHFLPPLGVPAVYDGVFDPSRSPVVQICRIALNPCTALVAEYTLPADSGVSVDLIAKHYEVDWNLDRFDLADGATYRIRVLLADRQIDYVDVIRNGRTLKHALGGEAIPLKGGSLPIRFRIEKGLELPKPVPPQAPGTTPRWIKNPYKFAPEAVDTLHEYMTGIKLKNVVVVIFAPGASQAERQLAVDRVGGEVVGGWGGHYLVRFPYDGTVEPLRRTVTALGALSQVIWVGPYFLDGFPA